MSIIQYREYVLEECERQWAECQEPEGHGPWAAQSEAKQREYFKDMYQRLWDDRFDLDDVVLPEDEEWQSLQGRRSDSLRVETPLGAIIVRTSYDSEHPGIWVDLRRTDAGCDMPLALVEFSADDVNFPDGDQNIITRVWGDSRQTDYTDRVVHQNIEEYFKD